MEQYQQSDEDQDIPEGFQRAVEVKQKFDDVLDNLNLIVNGVIQRDNMMLKYQYNPKLDNAKRKVT